MPESEAMAFEWLTTGDRAFAVAGDAIQAAQRSIRLEAYIYVDSQLGLRVLSVLLEARQRGVRVQLILAGKSDVPVTQLAAASLYRRLLKAGVEIYEYQPQILHAKLLLLDSAVYVGSANLDPRSLRINYELMVRFTNAEMVKQARAIFANTLTRCRRIELKEWRASRP